MKERFIKILAILSFILPLAAIGNAQTITGFNVPFEFSIRDKAFPAGEYTLRKTNSQHVWKITGKSDTKLVAYILASTSENVDRSKEVKMSFRKYVDRYFLAGFTVPDYQITLSQTKVEKYLLRELLAANKSVGDIEIGADSTLVNLK